MADQVLDFHDYGDLTLPEISEFESFVLPIDSVAGNPSAQEEAAAEFVRDHPEFGGKAPRSLARSKSTAGAAKPRAKPRAKSAPKPKAVKASVADTPAPVSIKREDSVASTEVLDSDDTDSSDSDSFKPKPKPKPTTSSKKPLGVAKKSIQKASNSSSAVASSVVLAPESIELDAFKWGLAGVAWLWNRSFLGESYSLQNVDEEFEKSRKELAKKLGSVLGGKTFFGPKSSLAIASSNVLRRSAKKQKKNSNRPQDQ